MHLNYLFLNYLTAELNVLLNGAVLTDAYTPAKDELLLEFELKKGAVFLLKLDWHKEYHGLSFPEEYRKPSRNWMPLFKELQGKKITSVEQITYDRSFIFHFGDQLQLFFRLHGSLANVSFLKDNQVEEKFRKSSEAQPEINTREPDLSRAAFDQVEGDPIKYFPVGGKHFRDVLNEKDYSSADLNNKWRLMQDLIHLSRQGIFYLCKCEGLIILSVFPVGEVLEEYTNAIEACNVLTRLHYRINLVNERKKSLTEIISRKLHANSRWLDNVKIQYDKKQAEAPPSQKADLIMANLHDIKEGQEFLSCLNFYTGERELIELKKNVSPQKFAETLYRKSKNRHLELEKMQANIDRKEEERRLLEDDLNDIEQAGEVKALMPFWKRYIEKGKAEEEELLPYKEYSFDGFKILVGRNAKCNDELTLHIAKKDDLWLHARDVSGSHVVIRQIPGRPYSKVVIELAASLAAWYSKRRNETLCPVIYTEKKNVRKVKGAAPGSVRVEKEKVVMVTPKEGTGIL
jgi:predicted ribosome quality control (RQC) complex YloA/Tae2 family protein